MKKLYICNLICCFCCLMCFIFQYLFVGTIFLGIQFLFVILQILCFNRKVEVEENQK